MFLFKQVMQVSSTPDHLVSMLTPVSAWATTFAIVSFPGGRSLGDIARVTTSQKNTVITVYDSGVSMSSPSTDTVVQRENDYLQVELSPNALVLIQTNKPVQVGSPTLHSSHN